MSVSEGQLNKKDNSKCLVCTTFYASEAYEGLCSSCFKKNKPLKKEEIVPKSATQQLEPIKIDKKQIALSKEEVTVDLTKKQQVDKKRCFGCNKKIGLLAIECKCGYIYCNMHRLPEEHDCGFNHKQNGKDKLKKEIIKVYNGKIQEI